MLDLTSYNDHLNYFKNIIQNIKGIYLISPNVFILKNAVIHSSLQIDYVDGKSCQITTYDDPYGKPHMKVNHTCSETISDYLCKHIVSSLLIYEICINPRGPFATEFLNIFQIPKYEKQCREMLCRFSEPIQKLLPIIEFGNMTIYPDFEDKHDITLNILFLQDIPDLVPETKRNKHLLPKTNESNDMDISDIILRQITNKNSM